MKNQFETANYSVDFVILEGEIYLELHNKINPDLPAMKLLLEKEDVIIWLHFLVKVYGRV